MAAGFAVGRWFGRCVSSGLWFPAAELSHHGLPLLPVPVGGLADTTKGVLLRVGRRLRGLCAASDFLLDDFRLAGGCALDGAGVLARLVCRAGAGVQEKIRKARRGAGSIHLDRAGIFPRRAFLGMYGVALVLMTLAASLSLLPRAASGILFGVCLIALGCFVNVPTRPPAGGNSAAVQVAGLQLEFPAESELLAALDEFAQKHPRVELVVLSEYSLQRPPSEEFKEWCRRYQRYLIVGGKDFVSDDKFYNTVFVVDPNGEVAFRQAKSVPVQFFADGLPAREQRLWNSPWGKIGFCICYDLSYRRVADRLVQFGAQAIVVPTADEMSWGEREHRLHARVAPTRAAEYATPIFRVSSSGISQLIDARGRVLATAPFPGQGAIIEGRLELGRPGHLPLDHWLAPLSALVTAAIILWLSAKTLLGKISRL
ncbi:MAG: hypothetical protein DME21_06700 [Verrucomicrobia bacterium]|nr:MAG: hypothetical protein DME21_06700 [Verrucomicrobiota bacterium]